MSVLDVSAGERGVIRVFALGATPDAMDAEAMASALGVDQVEMSAVELYRVADFAELGLDGYLREGLGVADDAVPPGALKGIGEAVAIVHSAAFGGQAVRLDPRPPLTLAAVYQEAQGERGDLMPLQSAAARGSVTAEAPAAPQGGGSGLSRALIVFGLVLLALVVLVLVLS